MLRLRCSAGLKLDSFVGPCGLSSADALVLPAVTKHTTVGVTLAHDTARKEAMPAVVTLQSALLYTGADRRRRIRVLTRNLPVTDSLERLVTSAHLPAATGLRAKLALARAAPRLARLGGGRALVDALVASCGGRAEGLELFEALLLSLYEMEAEDELVTEDDVLAWADDAARAPEASSARRCLAKASAMLEWLRSE